jgi:hypothetical protein
MVAALALQVAPRQPAQLSVDRLNQPRSRYLVSLVPGHEQSRDVRLGCAHGLLIRHFRPDETELRDLPRFP